MKLAFSRPTADAAEQRLLFASFRAAGFAGLQLKAGQFQPYLTDSDRFGREWGDDPGIVSGLITGGALDEAGLAALRRVIAFASAVGSERVIFCHSHPRAGVTPADLRRFAGRLNEVGEEARDAGVQISLHNHYDQPVMRLEEIEIFFASHPEAINLTLDTAHLVKSGVPDIARVIRTFYDVIDNIHLKDYADGQFRVLGEGEIDFAPVFQALRDVRYDGWLCADEESGGDLGAGMAASARFIRRWLPG
jgi:inosose dehydratase